LAKTSVARDEPPVPEDFYEQIEPMLYRRIAREVRDAARVLDLGCGGCELARLLASAPGKKVTGVDVDGDGFPDARSVEPRVRRRLRCVKADARRLGFVRSASMDAAVSTWALHEMRRAPEVLAEVKRVLRKGGELLIVDFPHDSLAQRLWDEDYYTPQEVRELLKEAGYAHVSVRLIQRKQVIWARAFRPLPEEEQG